ncbi:type II secretion system protein [Moritella sp. F3]|uniref:type II secretion system protein n=1 Tax=Moritella sp. F3 TaxID=2718882 RepID=UPI0018E1A485|nr:type II secretion system protein [Moritella sp. F3]GIC77577.1 pilin [Moritella sp. F1]GIC80038.1 pilin [Moritella sp. F3]
MKHRGFTLIELVIVIIVLGILAATAVPKFINLQNDAEKATLRGLSAGFKGGISIISSKHRLEGEPAVMTVGGNLLSFQSHATPDIINNPVAHFDGVCVLIWDSAVDGILASTSDSNDKVLTALDYNGNLATVRCNYAYKDVGSILYSQETNSICVQYTGDPEPEACKL